MEDLLHQASRPLRRARVISVSKVSAETKWQEHAGPRFVVKIHQHVVDVVGGKGMIRLGVSDK